MSTRPRLLLLITEDWYFWSHRLDVARAAWDAAIKRFDFTYELAWKTVQRVLRAQGVLCHVPKECLSEAFTSGLVRDSPLWVRMIEDPNLTVHTYIEHTAIVIYRNLKEYEPLFEELRGIK